MRLCEESLMLDRVAVALLKPPYRLARRVSTLAGLRLERIDRPAKGQADGTARVIYDRLSPEPIRVIFDIGANVGSMSRRFAAAFPEADIFAFEPVSANFALLSRNLADLSGIRLVQSAVGDCSGSATMLLDAKNPEAHRIGDGPGPTETVPVVTVDDFCNEHRIEQIGILKSDAEAYELQVLRGASRMLEKTRFVLIEFAGIEHDDNHTPFEDIHDILSPRGFRLVSIFEPFHKRVTQRFVFANALYVRPASLSL